jgi:type II secretion system protein I
MQPAYKHCPGFTLIETLLALLLVATIGLSVQQRVGQFHDERIILRDRQQAHWVAWNQLMLRYQSAYQRYPEHLRTPADTGDDDSLGRKWYYLNQRQATVSDNFYRFESSIYEVPVSSESVLDKQANSASLAMYLVLK